MKKEKLMKDTFLQTYGSFLSDIVNRTMVKKFNLDDNMVGYNKLLIALSSKFLEQGSPNQFTKPTAAFDNIIAMGELLVAQDTHLFSDGQYLVEVKGLSDKSLIFKIDLMLAAGHMMHVIEEKLLDDESIVVKVVDKNKAFGINRPGYVIPKSILDVDYEKIFKNVVTLYGCNQLTVGEDLPLTFKLA